MTEDGNNTALATKTLIANASAALQSPNTFNLYRLMDLCALMEASVLLDSLQTLRSSDSLPTSTLVQMLHREGILSDVPGIGDNERIRNAILTLPEDLVSRLDLSPAGATLDIGKLPEWYYTQNQSGANLIGRNVNEVGAVAGVDYSTTLDDLIARIDEISAYPSQRRGSAQQYIYRSNCYLVVAALREVDYFPDFARVPFVMGTIRQLYRSLPMQLYDRVSSAFNETLGGGEIVNEWRLDARLPIPAISAIVLHRASSLAQIPQTLLEVRGEFARFRDYFSSFKRELRTADTLSRRMKLIARYRELLTSASGPHREFITLSEGLSFAQAATTALAAPGLPTSYSANLLSQPLQWIRRWWLRRPLSVLFRMDSKLPSISQYSTLAAKHWGDPIQAALLREFTSHSSQISRLLNGPWRPYER